MIDVADGANVDVRLVSLKCSGISSCGGHELRLAPGAQGALDGVGWICAQGTRGAKKGLSERHDARRGTRERKTRGACRDGREMMPLSITSSRQDAGDIFRASLASRACLEGDSLPSTSGELLVSLPTTLTDRIVSDLLDCLFKDITTTETCCRLNRHYSNTPTLTHRSTSRGLQLSPMVA